MGDPRGTDPQPDESSATDPPAPAAEEPDLTRVAEEWRRQTREADEQRKREAEEQQESKAKAPEEKEMSPLGCLSEGVNCCYLWSLTILACTGLGVVVAALVWRARG